MITSLKKFTGKSLFDATSLLLEELHIKFDRETAEPIDVADLYDQPMPLYLREALTNIEKTYFIGIANDDSLQGRKSDETLEAVAETIQQGGKYDGMFIFACDAKPGANLTRSASSALTRAFNRIASANPVILFIRQGNLLSLATCERMEYTQAWRQGSGEKLGKVNILRNIDCVNTHRGHNDILESLGDKAYSTFEELYKHWLEVFSSELLTKKFYNELSDWYAWAVQVVKFPNDLSTTEDDEKYNHESCIRLITRLIFVWFLKQKHLIPDEFFDEEYIRANFIENFDPHDRRSLYYDAESSKYYRAILQNLFFATLNCPIVADGNKTACNRKFRKADSFNGKNVHFNINNLMRYENDFKEGGAKKFLNMANKVVPFLNGGLFDCLDEKRKGMYYDGFSERKESLAQLYLPDWLFFGEEVGAGIDLSQWYGDAKKKSVSARGIIDILKRYSFTIEENTPYDQEVSLDPELLGKVFENLLAAYNPETKTSARKQTGSFYTPREIVQYMVNESLVAHLKRICGEEGESKYRALLDYATDEVELTKTERHDIMNALYNCRVLDPACGSGAFPMGVLQQMVHVLKRIDPSNDMWKDLMINRAIEQSKLAFAKDSEEERKARLLDIEEAFNTSLNDPDYARKLYLIEHCIYGVDIQPIATQISKLRFFISLVADQKPTKDNLNNFGIRPLPNLESKFVAANTLIPLDRTKDLFTSSDEIRDYEQLLQDINHRMFLAKKSSVKERLRQEMYAVRGNMAQALENMGAIGYSGFKQLTSWNMFDQNASAPFFDPEWMFGVKEGFDVVIGNPPYIRRTSLSEKDKNSYERVYKSADGQYDIYLLFIEKGLLSLTKGGFLCFINPIRFFNSDYGMQCRKFVAQSHAVNKILDVSQLSVFENATTYPCVLLIENNKHEENFIEYIAPNKLSCVLNINLCESIKFSQTNFEGEDYLFVVPKDLPIFNLIKKIDLCKTKIEKYYDVARGLANNKVDFDGFGYKAIKSKSVRRYAFSGEEIEIDTNYADRFTEEMLIMPRTVAFLQATIKRKNLVLLDRIYYLIPQGRNCPILKYVLGLFNSRLTNFWFEYYYESTKVRRGYFDLNGNQIKSIPIPIATKQIQNRIVELVNCVMKGKASDYTQYIEEESEIDHLVYHLYNLTYEEVLIIDPETPITREEYESYKEA